ncbi:hypothetical protein AAFF_G00139580 [Aldrovandia affinis]|uniref:Uncharacterized protein n=1 Tax=Aldrovandia affinis TaxID=143900 RepID=A0AAD7TC65_9TELE|nr:hypothetical protein AAFF_G00139580 [Aldrovandia affinis]
MQSFGSVIPSRGFSYHFHASSLKHHLTTTEMLFILSKSSPHQDLSLSFDAAGKSQGRVGVPTARPQPLVQHKLPLQSGAGAGALSSGALSTQLPGEEGQPEARSSPSAQTSDEYYSNPKVIR